MIITIIITIIIDYGDVLSDLFAHHRKTLSFDLFL